jgi:excisionase family DNA binding protein
MEDEKPEGQSYTPEEVALKLNCHVSTVQGLLRDGKLKGFKLNRQWRITPEELQRFQSQAVSQ